MTTVLRAQVSLPNGDTIPSDAAVNVWHFESFAVDRLVSAGAIVAELNNFYLAIDGLMSGKLSGELLIKVYDLSDSTPRAPILEYVGSFTPGVAAPLPHECAICLSYSGPVASGTPAGRRKGRIFLGPWTIATLDDGTGDAIVDAGAAGAILAAAVAFGEAGSGSTYRWSVFSPTAAGTPPWTTVELAAGTLPVTDVYVDDAFDTVRSRGAAALNRFSDTITL